MRASVERVQIARIHRNWQNSPRMKSAPSACRFMSGEDENGVRSNKKNLQAGLGLGSSRGYDYGSRRRPGRSISAGGSSLSDKCTYEAAGRLSSADCCGPLPSVAELPGEFQRLSVVDGLPV